MIYFSYPVLARLHRFSTKRCGIEFNKCIIRWNYVIENNLALTFVSTEYDFFFLTILRLN